jgi:hypothetical protein
LFLLIPSQKVLTKKKKTGLNIDNATSTGSMASILNTLISFVFRWWQQILVWGVAARGSVSRKIIRHTQDGVMSIRS